MKRWHYSPNDAVRMIGHLLLHHPTTRAEARSRKGTPVSGFSPRASCWCLVGAIQAVSGVLSIGDRCIEDHVKEALRLKEATETEKLIEFWDRANDDGRKRMATKLTRVTAR